MAIEAKALLLKGSFDEQDWTELLATLRRIEQRHPEEAYCATYSRSGN
jgi:hypothetical protein